MKNLFSDRKIWFLAVLLGFIFTVFELTELDLWIQDLLFDRETGEWMVDSKDPRLKWVFYTGPKVFIIILAVILLGLILAPVRFLERFAFGRRALLVALLTLATAPALVALGKATTDVFCPAELIRYGGKYPYQKVADRYEPGERPLNRKGKPAHGRCFPAGHASGGFALFGLAALASTARGRRIALLAGLGMGIWMGGYQMLKGAHFLSHTLITAIFCGIVFLAWQRVVNSLPVSR